MKNLLLLFIAAFLFTASGPKLKNTHIVEGVSADLPEDFVVMPDKDIAQKYPSTKKPLAMFTSLDRTVDFGLNVSKSSWSGSNFDLLKKIYKSTIVQMYDNVSFSKDTTEKINGKDFILFEFTATSEGTTKYSYLAYTIIGNAKDKENSSNRVYIFNFTTEAGQKAKWQETANAVMHSIKIEHKKLAEIVNEEQPVHKGKRPIQIMKEQKTTSTPAKKK